MDDKTNIQRLTEALEGTGCEVSRARLVWALNASLTDEDIARLAGWAELEFLMADYTDITDISIPTINDFPLTHLSICETSITADAFLSFEWPMLQGLGVSGISFAHHSIDPLLASRDLEVIAANGSHLNTESVSKLACLPKLAVFEAFEADVPHDAAQEISLRHAGITFRFDDGVWRGGKLINPS